MKSKTRLTNVIIITSLSLTAATAWASGTWRSTGSMRVGRYSFTATLLPTGKVLVAGGDTPGEIITNTAELYHPTTGTFTPTRKTHPAPVCLPATLLTNRTA